MKYVPGGKSRAKKSLGQHWLHDEPILQSIVRAGSVVESDSVLEIGPGLGTLTQQLADTGADITALEFDQGLLQGLGQKFDNTLQVKIEQGDVRTYDFTQMPADYKVVANIPYYLTSHLIRSMSESANQPSVAVLLIQKEVAQRLCARPSQAVYDPSKRAQSECQTELDSKEHSMLYVAENVSCLTPGCVRVDEHRGSVKVIPGQMGVLSVTAQFYFDCQLDIEVAAEYFTPPPKVDSQVVVLTRRSTKLFDVNDQDLFRLVKAGFSEKRKTMRNSLSGGLDLPKEAAEELLTAAGLATTIRAQELSLSEWHSLYLQYEKQSKNT